MTNHDFKQLSTSVGMFIVYTIGMFNSVIYVVICSFTAFVFCMCLLDTRLEKTMVIKHKFDSKIVYLINRLLLTSLWLILFLHEEYLILVAFLSIFIYAHLRLRRKENERNKKRI